MARLIFLHFNTIAEDGEPLMPAIISSNFLVASTALSLVSVDSRSAGTGVILLLEFGIISYKHNISTLMPNLE